MSFFPELLEESWSDREHEVAPGVFVERRRLIVGSAAAFAALVLAPALRAQETPQEEKPKPERQPGRVTFEDACAKMHDLASKLVAADAPNEDAYLFQVAALLLQLDATPDASLRGGRKVAMGRVWSKTPLSIVQIRMEPGASLPWHDHRDYNGVLFGLDGAIRVKNFEVEGKDPRPPRGESFEIRETTDVMLDKGRVSSLGRTRDNVHDLRAGAKGGRVLDVFTYFGRGRSVYMDVDPDPVDGERRVYRAKWK
jgi:predicted metal-dependent enzyme (double-stranded beta helix superfamily)